MRSRLQGIRYWIRYDERGNCSGELKCFLDSDLMWVSSHMEIYVRHSLQMTMGGVNDLSHGVLYMNELKQVGQIYGTEVEPNPQACRIYDSDGISPCLDSCQGGCRMPKIEVGVVKACLTPDRLEKRQNGRRFKEDGEPMFTITAQDKHGVLLDDGTEVRIRKLTPRECFRLQGFPDEYFDRAAAVCSDSQLYKQAGNSVTVNVIYEIAKRLKEIKDDNYR